MDCPKEAWAPAIAHAESFGEFDPAMPGYALATAFDELWLQPSGAVGLHGLAAAVPFLRAALDKLGIEPRISQRYEYKNAADTLQRTGFTEAHREAATGLLESLAEQLVADVGLAEQQPFQAATPGRLIEPTRRGPRS